MSKEKKNTQNEKRKLSRQEKKQIAAVIKKAKGDGKPHSAQDSIPFERMYKDGICRLAGSRYSKCIEFEDINYQLAQPDDKTAIFEALCDMYNSFDASISVQLSLISRYANKEDFKQSITIPPQGDDFDSIRAEYTEMLQRQLERGNNGLIKTKFLTFTTEAKDIKTARARLSRIETDTLNHFKVIGAAARPLDGAQRLEVLHGIFHPDGERFHFSWDWLPASGLFAVIGLTLLLSAKMKSPYFVLIVLVPVLFIPLFLSPNGTTGAYNLTLFLFPYRSTIPEIGKYISYQFGGLVLDVFSMRAILYAILIAVMLPFARRGFKKHQVA